MSATTADIPSKYSASRTARIAFCGTKSLRSLPRKMPALASLGPPCRPEGGGKALPRRPSRPGRALRRAAGAALRPHRAGESPRPLIAKSGCPVGLAAGRGYGGLGPHLCRLVFEGARGRGHPCAGACAEVRGGRPAPSWPGLFSTVWISVRGAGTIRAPTKARGW